MYYNGYVEGGDYKSMDNGKIIITNKNLIEPIYKCEHEPYEYNKYEVTKRSKENKCYVAI